jgi:hypothetical protein
MRLLRVCAAPPVPASEQRQVALLLGQGIFLDDLGVIRVEDPPRYCVPYTAARVALDPGDQTPGSAQGVLLGRRGPCSTRGARSSSSRRRRLVFQAVPQAPPGGSQLVSKSKS